MNSSSRIYIYIYIYSVCVNNYLRSQLIYMSYKKLEKKFSNKYFLYIKGSNIVVLYVFFLSNYILIICVFVEY